MIDWIYSILAYAGPTHKARPLALVLQTTHASKTSLDTEIAAFQRRMACGKISYIEVLDHRAGTTEKIYPDTSLLK